MKTIELDTLHGAAIATQVEKGLWHIAYPWCDDRMYGTTQEVKARMRRAIESNRKADEEPQP